LGFFFVGRELELGQEGQRAEEEREHDAHHDDTAVAVLGHLHLLLGLVRPDVRLAVLVRRAPVVVVVVCVYGCGGG
jgi:hypothetical protein